MRRSKLIYDYYTTTWHQIVVGWLGWSEERFAAWVVAWESQITDGTHGLGNWFYHEDELYYVLDLLVPDELGQRLAKQRTRRMYHDLANPLYDEIKPAITGRPHHPSWGTEAFDWAEAKLRMEAVLRQYDVTLPGRMR